jgi:hypothetical protein
MDLYAKLVSGLRITNVFQNVNHRLFHVLIIKPRCALLKVLF